MSNKTAIALGASGMQIGTTYLLCLEATTRAVHRVALRSDTARHTALTNLFTGRPARAIANQIVMELGLMSDVAPAFPLASAAIAPGVLLQADPDSKIVVAAGVCIGAGSILHADQGMLEIEAGVSLGAGFLMVGEGKIGVSACIGSATTILNCSVEAGRVIAPGSILGDTSRRISEFSESVTNETKQLEPLLQGESEMASSGERDNNHSTTHSVSENSQHPLNGNHATLDSPTTQNSEKASTDSLNNFGAHVYGQGNIQRLLIALFPHRQSLSKPLSDEKSE